MNSNTNIIRNAITTGNFVGDGNGGYLQPFQAKKFIQQTFEVTNLGPLVRHEMRVEKTGEIDKIGIARRILRGKTENVDDGYRASVNTSNIKYATTAVRLPWEITEETLRENIEGENLEKIITDLMTSQLGVDLEDIYLNGDEETPEQYNAGTEAAPDMQPTPDYNFLKLNNGWIKQLVNGSHIIDKGGSKGMNVGLFYDALEALPNKYNNGKLRWLMSPRRSQEWERYLLEQIVSNGGAAPESLYKTPAGILPVACPSMSDDKIILTDPKNLIVVNTYSMKIRKTTEGEKAIMQDKRFYVVHLDFDTIIEELDAAAIITGLK